MDSTWFDEIAKACTAWDTWEGLVNAIVSGYTPTVYPDTRRKALLRRILLGCGFAVYPYRTFPSDRR